MSFLYKAPHMNVRPFLIVPTAITDQEANMVIGPTELHESCDSLVAEILNKTSPFISSTVTLSQWYKHNILIAQSYLSDVKDIKTKRKGLYLIYGALVRPSTFKADQSICEFTFNKINKFFEKKFNINIDNNNLDPIVASFQSIDINIDDIIDKIDTRKMLQEFECHYFLNHQNNGLLWNFLAKRFFSIRSTRITRKQPCYDLSGALDFWRILDKDMNISSRAHKESIRKTNDSNNSK